MPKLCPSIIIICAALVSAACGGGGSSASSTAPVIMPEPSPPEPTTFALTGTISVSNSQSVDADTNDPAHSATANDTPAQAQSIPSPTTLGGYVNQPGSGATGRSFDDGDSDDFFRVNLLAGQQINLLIADPQLADLELLLWNTQGTEILDFAAGGGAQETLIAPATGEYLLNVFASAGGSNYILAIGGASAAVNTISSRQAIIPWQAVVKYGGAIDAQLTGLQDELATSYALTQRTAGLGRGRLLAMAQHQLCADNSHHPAQPGQAKLAHMPAGPLHESWETLLTVKAIARHHGVAYAEPNYRVQAQFEPDDEAYPLQWHYPLIALPQAWDTSMGDANVIIAVIDTGVLSNHPDLVGQLVQGYDFVRDISSAQDGDGIDPDPEDPGIALGSGSQNFHGTHVSGTVAARGDNILGVAGAAYGARVMPLRALGAGGGGTSYDVEQAVRFAAGLANDSGTRPAQAADIINLSLGGGPFSAVSQQLYDEVHAAGIVVVAAAGNEASTAPFYPASYNNVIGVSAVDAQRRLANYSNTGPNVDVAAPGGDNTVDLNGDGYPDGVLSTGASITDGSFSFAYSFQSGTSMAAPHVSGVLALMLSVNPALQAADIHLLLENGALSDDLGPSGRDDAFGYGLINAQQALLAALAATGSAPTANPRLIASSRTLNFGSSATTLELTLRNGGNGPLELLELVSSEPWLRVNPVTVDANDLGLYQVTIDRDDLPDGLYAARLSAQSSVNDIIINVIATVGDPASIADVGVIYVLLYDLVTNEPVDQFVSSGSNGEYRFSFSNQPPGQYEIIAGSDADNDLLICDAGEACGAWLSLDQPRQIELNSDQTDLDFPVEYLVTLPGISSNATATPVARPYRRLPD